ncbi:MAG: 50S ribosomal protein L25 [Planctomycetaceae bacterium]|nr:50S ribosomal protein L25 [Planctomycetaceae bacterium]
MSENEVLNVSIRESRGTREARRMRAQGQTPAILYGHGEESVSLALSANELSTFLRHGGKVTKLEGAVSDNALVRDVQWDALGNEILHVDLTRVSLSEQVETAVGIDLRGEAPGVRSGGVIQHLLHEIQLKCPVHSIPDRLHVSVGTLELGNTITVSDLEIPEGAEVLADPSSVVVQCVEPTAESEEEATVADGAEPEVIGRKESDEEGDSDS